MHRPFPRNRFVLLFIPWRADSRNNINAVHSKVGIVYSCSLATFGPKAEAASMLAWTIGNTLVIWNLSLAEFYYLFGDHQALPKHPGKLRWFCVFRSVLLDSDGFCKQKSWFPVSTQPPYGVRICCVYALCPLHPRAADYYIFAAFICCLSSNLLYHSFNLQRVQHVGIIASGFSFRRLSLCRSCHDDQAFLIGFLYTILCLLPACKIISNYLFEDR